MKQFILIFLALAMTLSLTACASPYDKEYYSETDYELPSKSESSVSVVVKNKDELTQAITDIILDGNSEDKITFDALYQGDINEDLSNACWTVRTQDAFCAYCVESLSFELMKVMANSEACISVTYSQSEEMINSVVRMNYSYGAEGEILSALNRGEEHLPILISYGSYSQQDMESLVESVYRENPLCVHYEPKVSVILYSGASLQKLYDIAIDYRVTPEELEECRERIKGLELFPGIALLEYTKSERALMACSYLIENCALIDSSGSNSAYCALIDGRADSEGIALAYAELCRRLGITCRVVYGQQEWVDHCWNIITIDGENYHVDVSRCMLGDIASGFLKNDRDMWDSYRWDMSYYPKCDGKMKYTPEKNTPETTENTEQTASGS